MLLLLSGFALGICCVLILLVGRDFGHLAVGKAFVATVLAGSFFLFGPHLPDPFDQIAASISTMVPALFWVLCQYAFGHRAQLFNFIGLVALISFVAPAIYRFSPESLKELTTYRTWLWVIPSYGEYLLMLSGIWVVVSNWDDDLVESRRRLRGGFLVAVAIAILLVIVPMNTGIADSWLPYSSVGVISLVCAYFLLQGSQGLLFAEPLSAPADTQPAQSAPDISQEQQTLNQLMTQGFYRTEYLTLKILAQELDLPEYRTRALINQELGYRNFNDYINQLRIEDAAQRLLLEPQTPVLNISLDVGYRTLSSFNRAFKDIKTMSPSEFRQQQLAAS